jgi:hypothetical protein
MGAMHFTTLGARAWLLENAPPLCFVFRAYLCACWPAFFLCIVPLCAVCVRVYAAMEFSSLFDV